jgi:hypothetical protein
MGHGVQFGTRHDTSLYYAFVAKVRFTVPHRRCLLADRGPQWAVSIKQKIVIFRKRTLAAVKKIYKVGPDQPLNSTYAQTQSTGPAGS